jgi:hypothetical protein
MCCNEPALFLGFSGTFYLADIQQSWGICKNEISVQRPQALEFAVKGEECSVIDAVVDDTTYLSTSSNHVNSGSHEDHPMFYCGDLGLHAYDEVEIIRFANTLIKSLPPILEMDICGPDGGFLHHWCCGSCERNLSFSDK